MNLVLDTTILIDHLRGDPGATAFLDAASQGEDELWSATVVRTEVLAGMQTIEQSRTTDLLNNINWQDITVEIADRAGSLARRYLRTHPGIDTVDYLLAATAEFLNGSLCTANVRHFPMSKGLKPAY